jgi:hypothetical protein
MKIGIFKNCFSKEKPVDQVHESVDRIRVAGPRFHHGLHSGRRQGLTRARPSGRSVPRGTTGGPLTGARTMVRRWRTDRKKLGGATVVAPWRGRRRGQRPWHGGAGGGRGGARPAR